MLSGPAFCYKSNERSSDRESLLVIHLQKIDLVLLQMPGSMILLQVIYVYLSYIIVHSLHILLKVALTHN